MYYIYKHENKITHHCYIGQTKDNLQRRWRPEGKGYEKCPKFWNAICAYGWDNFTHEILEIVETSEEANEKEVYWIDYYNSYYDGYNCNIGGNNYLEKKWQEPEYREQMKKSFSIAKKKKWQDVDFAKIAQEKMQEGIKQFWADEEKREKRIEALQGDKNPNHKVVVNIETGKIFTTIKEAAQWAGTNNVGGIGQCCRGKQKTCGRHPISKEKLHWMFYKGGAV